MVTTNNESNRARWRVMIDVNDVRKQILAKFKRFKTKNKLCAEDAAKITGYSLRTLQLWMAKLGQHDFPKRKTPILKAFLDDISADILQFIRDEYYDQWVQQLK